MAFGRRLKDAQGSLPTVGNIRIGDSTPYTTSKGNQAMKPRRFQTFALTSANADAIRQAAELFGGTPEQWSPQGRQLVLSRVITDTNRLPILIPPGEALDQVYEMWTGSKAVRRCDGEVDEISRRPCPCRAQFGDEFYLQPVGVVCKRTSRLRVFLELPGLGYWMLTTRGFFASEGLLGSYELFRAVLRNRLGGAVPYVAIEAMLTLDYQTKPTAKGQLATYPVVGLQLGISAAQMLQGLIPVIGGSEIAGGGGVSAIGGGGAAAQVAIEAAPVADPQPIVVPATGPVARQAPAIDVPLDDYPDDDDYLTDPEDDDGIDPTGPWLERAAAAADGKDLNTILQEARKAHMGGAPIDPTAIVTAINRRRAELDAAAPAADPAATPEPAPVAATPAPTRAELKAEALAEWQATLGLASSALKWNLPKLREQFAAWHPDGTQQIDAPPEDMLAFCAHVAAIVAEQRRGEGIQ